MDPSDIAMKVAALTKAGDIQGLRLCLCHVTQKSAIEEIVSKTENGRCDVWCATEHNADSCPTEYDALRLARAKHLHKVVSLLQEIQDGVRTPGESLPDLNRQATNDFKQEKINSKISHKVIQQTITKSSPDEFKTNTTLAKERLEELGRDHIAKNGDTPLHQAVSYGPELVYVCANAGLFINSKNFEGDSPLHIAVRQNNLPVSRALLSCGADLSIRNKLGQLPGDLSNSNLMKNLLADYKPGLVNALIKADSAALLRLIKLWCHPCAIIKKGKSALDLARSRQNEDAKRKKCYQLLQQASATLRLVHTVLAEDVNTLKDILQSEQDANVNVRYQGTHGKTPLSCALEQGHMETVQLLIDTGKCHVNIRVPEDVEDPSMGTVPLFFKTLTAESPTELWRFMADRVDSSVDFEKDQDGNTPVMRAIRNGKSTTFLEDLIRSTPFNRLMLRNKDGQTPHDVAISMGRDEVVELLNQKLLTGCREGCAACLPVSFFDYNFAMSIRTKDNKSLEDVIGSGTDALSLKHYSDIQNLGCDLFKAAADGDVKTIEQLNTAVYIDQNGYTALTRAVVHVQPAAVEALLVSKPELRLIGDNCNRYPLHYAYALPGEDREDMVKLLLARAPQTTVNRVDKDGLEPVEYKELSHTAEMLKILHDVKTLDPFGKILETDDTREVRNSNYQPDKQ